MTPVANIQVTARGAVSQSARARVAAELADLDRIVTGSILAVRVVLIQEPNPRIARPARAAAEVDLQGRLICARTAAPTMEAAIDDLAERLRRQLRRYVERMITREREPAVPPPG